MAGLEVKAIESLGKDTVFELEVTPNRPDCLSVLGVAREASAVFNKSLKIPKITAFTIPKEKIDISIADKKDCPRYIGTLIKGVPVTDSPAWLKERLAALGLRPVNNIVDITNFTLMETGQPLHAFDYDKLIGGKIIVRRAKEGEGIVTLDGVERKLDPSILVIADAQRPVAVAGVMGGRETEVSPTTKNILLESACFDPLLIRRACRKLGLASDSSYRFERGVDVNAASQGARRAIDLITAQTGAGPCGYRDLYLTKKVERTVTVSCRQISALLGMAVSSARCRTILKKLGFKIISVKKNILKAAVPSFRHDVKEEVDIAEEIARIIGYDTLPISLPAPQFFNRLEDTRRCRRQALSGALRSCGLNEAISYAMIGKKNLEKTNLISLNPLRVKNPLSAEQEFMRPSLLPGLLSAITTNLNRGRRDIRLFETGNIYSADGEKEAVGIILTGRRYPGDWRSNKEEVDFYDLKGMVTQALKALGVNPQDLQFNPAAEAIFQKGHASRFKLSDCPMGFLGRLAQGILTHWDIKHKNVFYAQIDIQRLYQKTAAPKRYQPLWEYPAVIRDLSLAVKTQVSFRQLSDAACGAGGELLKEVKFVEQYIGDKIPSGHRGITLSFVYQSPQRTLREEEVNGLHEKISQEIIGRFGAIKR